MTFETPRKSFSSFSISSLVMLGFLLGFNKHSSVVMHVPDEMRPLIMKKTAEKTETIYTLTNI